MTAPKGNELRDAVPADNILPPKILSGEGFEIHPSRVKVYKPTGAPAYFYDVFTDDNTRVGIASLILEQDPQEVSEIGHVCARLSEEHDNPELLKQVGELLISHGHQCGLSDIHIVVPEQSECAVTACESIGNTCSKAYFDRNGEKFIRFQYLTGGGD
ncbi:hypothetical protein [Paraburkholderia sp. J7]|uniref:hypothetical protein n=1 Tax=Paraburkholderia sp. J7 TaxID=2805438 RepID=UPI002AB64AC0|nr:hypothetical protein [Paraburkholderia sp. J7]